MMTTSPDGAFTPPTSGIAVIDKPAGLTSHQVVARLRRRVGTRKVGHAGTLDPMATGVLVVGIGRATRLLGYLALTDKAFDTLEVDRPERAVRWITRVVQVLEHSIARLRR